MKSHPLILSLSFFPPIHLNIRTKVYIFIFHKKLNKERKRIKKKQVEDFWDLCVSSNFLK